MTMKNRRPKPWTKEGIARREAQFESNRLEIQRKYELERERFAALSPEEKAAELAALAAERAAWKAAQEAEREAREAAEARRAAEEAREEARLEKVRENLMLAGRIARKLAKKNAAGELMASKTSSGSVSSYYLRFNGENFRISDHKIPATWHRDSVSIAHGGFEFSGFRGWELIVTEATTRNDVNRFLTNPEYYFNPDEETSDY